MSECSPGTYSKSATPPERSVMNPQRIWVAYHLLYLAPQFTDPDFDGTGERTLVAVADQGRAIVVVTGCATGPVRVSLTSHPSPLQSICGDGWEVVEEVSLSVPEPLFWSSPDPGPDLPAEAAFTPTTPGVHRARISGRGRSNAYDLSIQEPVEDYLIEIWAEPAPRVSQVLFTDQPNPD